LTRTRNLAERGNVSPWLMTVSVFGAGALGLSQIGQTGDGGAEFFGPAIIDPGLTLVLMVLTVALNAIYEASETAIDVLRPVHARIHRESDPPRADAIVAIMDRRAKYTAASMLGSRFASVALVVLSFVLAHGIADRLGGSLGWAPGFGTLLKVAILVALPAELLNLLFGQFVPKNYAQLHPDKVALRFERFVAFSAAFFGVFTWLLTQASAILSLKFAVGLRSNHTEHTEEEIRTLVESAESTGAFEQDERELIDSVFEFRDTIAREVMTPRVDLDSVPASSTLESVAELIHKTGHSRIPLYEETDDQIVGIVHAKDLLYSLANRRNVTLRELMRTPHFVPESKGIQDLLREMQNSKSQMAIVQDEFGGTAGIVTIEDIIEELVGDIVDEYDNELPAIQETEAGWIVDGKTHRDDVNYRIGSNFESEEFDTIGGYVFGLFGRQPQLNEAISDDQYEFSVTKTDGRRIHQLRIKKKEAENLLDLMMQSER
jgi:putative hemolysin